MATIIPASQVDQPGKATARTVVQTMIGVLLALGAVVPAVVAIIGAEWARWTTPEVLAVLSTVAAVSAAISGTVARIMAIPQINDLLGAVGLRVEGWALADPVTPQHAVDDGDTAAG